MPIPRLSDCIWRALGNTKADVARLQEACPELENHVRKIRGGFLKIQGTWFPYDLAKELSRRVAFHLRDELVPLFGYDFPDSCLRPGDPEFGRLLIGPKTKSRRKNSYAGPHQTSVFGPARPVTFFNDRIVETQPPPPCLSSATPIATCFYPSLDPVNSHNDLGQRYVEDALSKAESEGNRNGSLDRSSPSLSSRQVVVASQPSTPFLPPQTYYRHHQHCHYLSAFQHSSPNN